ncbi:MAG: TetR/AcrR family transcriptional regulator [Spirochaetes bacterium]|jgi:AcrR family transcriptional regulator|nr:TetR/AcrR family transcriptional regulator [Spirochaetota bacterium]
MSPRSQKLNNQMRSQTLAKIDSAALKVFAACGYHGATMRRIAQAAGLSYGLVYHYYPSKAKVFRRLVDFALTGSLEAMQQFMHASGSAWERMTAYAAMVVSSLFAGDTSLYFVIILQAMTQGRAIAGLPAHISRMFGRYYELLVPVIKEAQASGEAAPGDPAALAAGFFSMVQGLAMLTFQHQGLEERITPALLVNALRNPGYVPRSQSTGRPRPSGRKA